MSIVLAPLLTALEYKPLLNTNHSLMVVTVIIEKYLNGLLTVGLKKYKPRIIMTHVKIAIL